MTSSFLRLAVGPAGHAPTHYIRLGDPAPDETASAHGIAVTTTGDVALRSDKSIEDTIVGSSTVFAGSGMKQIVGGDSTTQIESGEMQIRCNGATINSSKDILFQAENADLLQYQNFYSKSTLGVRTKHVKGTATKLAHSLQIKLRGCDISAKSELYAKTTGTSFAGTGLSLGATALKISHTSKKKSFFLFSLSTYLADIKTGTKDTEICAIKQDVGNMFKNETVGGKSKGHTVKGFLKNADNGNHPVKAKMVKFLLKL